METLLLLRKNARKRSMIVFSFDNIKTDDSLLTFYTGFPNVQTMMALYEYLDPGVNGKILNTGCLAKMTHKRLLLVIQYTLGNFDLKLGQGNVH